MTGLDVRIETLEAMPVARIRHVGPYREIGPCFERLLGWAASTGATVGRTLTLSHDDPEATPPEEVRSDACVEVETGEAPPDGIVLDSVGAGRYAVHTYRGPYEGIADRYRRLFGEWLPGSGQVPDDRPCMEIYRNSPLEVPPSELVTDLCLPLRASDDA